MYVTGILLGDSGYPQRDYLFTPVLNPISHAENRYNLSLKKTRNLVERSFGILKRKFPILSRRLQNKLRTSINIIICCAILHNITRLENVDIPEENINAQNIADMPEENVNENAAGREIRNRFIIQHFR